jgi:hypothetical protein
MCNYPNCKKIPSYNIQGETKGLYCYEHKKDGMKNMRYNTCYEKECDKIPSYNIQGETKGLYCSEHKKNGMVNVRHETCYEEGCKKLPSYNFKGKIKRLYCSEHKKDGMVNIKDNTCYEEGCKTQPSYNFKGKIKRLYCNEHKKDGMVNINSKTCKSEWCLTQVHQIKYDGYCLFCFINLFPDKPVARNYKTKEYAVVEFIKNEFPNFDWKIDKKISDGCSKRRPDLLLDLLYQIIIIEIDENQHINYDCSCENKRIMELSQDVGHRPIVLIRFNPDEYKKSHNKHTSCWGMNKNGICVVKKSKKNEWDERLNCLKNTLLYWINPENITNKTIETLNLFYDE